MPLVRISISSKYPNDVARIVSDGVHAALVATIDVLAADRFQVVTQHAPARSESAVFVQVFLAESRSDEKKRALYARIVANLTANEVVRRQDILIVLSGIRA